MSLEDDVMKLKMDVNELNKDKVFRDELQKKKDYEDRMVRDYDQIKRVNVTYEWNAPQNWIQIEIDYKEHWWSREKEIRLDSVLEVEAFIKGKGW